MSQIFANLHLHTRMTNLSFLIPAAIIITLVGVAAIILLLQLPQRFRRPLITAIVFISGLYYSLEYFIPTQMSKSGSPENFITPTLSGFMEPFGNIVGGLMFGVGLYSIFQIHLGKTLKRSKDWVYSAALLASVLIMAFVAFGSRGNQRLDVPWKGTMQLAGGGQECRLRFMNMHYVRGSAKTDIVEVNGLARLTRGKSECYYGPINMTVNKGESTFTIPFKNFGPVTFTGLVNQKSMQGEIQTATGQKGSLEVTRKWWIDDTYTYLFDGVMQNVDAAMFSLVAFYILSAAYRAFRLRSVESSILMASALVVILGLSFGTVITGGIDPNGLSSNLRVETWSGWILSVVSAPALRAIEFGVAIGSLAMSLRMWLGIERGALFGD